MVLKSEMVWKYWYEFVACGIWIESREFHGLPWQIMLLFYKFITSCSYAACWSEICSIKCIIANNIELN